ncbi:DUF5960 family protein [Enterococcus thailandicus]|uniref:DUF5960 family protein n=1 Tax=Enterococcus TaxID=1350 RepID=UPI00289219E3|nr:DUF5960 family protein [Enterococcus thailandicus]MDT2752191.1 DUF5960 family protein [Enterococcus thailandicus]MDT2776684.1 DUF5960 family protein [Enterococcus thailandicus]
MLEIDGFYLWFNYDPSHKFVNDLYRFWNTEIIFEAIEDRLLINLYYSQKNYIKISASKSRNRKSVYFLFHVKTDVPDVRKKHQRYDYVGYSFIKPDKE